MGNPRLLALLAVALAAPADAGILLVSGYTSNSISRFDSATGTHLGDTVLPGVLAGTLALRQGPDGLIYAASENTQSVVRIDPFTGAYVDTFIAPGSGGLTQPCGLDFGPDGDLYITSFDADSVLKFDYETREPLGTVVSKGSGTLNGPDVGFTFGPDGNMYIPSFWNHRVLRYSASGEVIDRFIDAREGGLTRPRMVIHRSDGLVYVTSDSGDKVLRFTAAGDYVDDFIPAGTEGLDGACGLAFDDATGVMYLTSVNNDRVMKFDAATGAYLGDLFSPGSVALDGPTFVVLVIPAPASALILGFAPVLVPRRRR